MGANGSARLLADTPLNPIERGVLAACHEATIRRQEMLPILAEVIGVAPNDVFYTWMMRRGWLLSRCGQHGPLGDTGWAYFFHGFECDLSHDDGRLLRYDFGPGGRVDTFTAWGVLQFIMTAREPWPEVPELRQYFAEHGPPFDRHSGSIGRMCDTWDALEARGVFEPADPALVEFEARHTSIGADGLQYIQYPPETPESTTIDCHVAHRPILSVFGRRLLAEAHVAAHAG